MPQLVQTKCVCYHHPPTPSDPHVATKIMIIKEISNTTLVLIVLPGADAWDTTNG